jgi:hypothetical protein
VCTYYEEKIKMKLDLKLANPFNKKLVTATDAAII